MNKEVLVITIICQLWPILREPLKKAVEDSTSPIDDWVFKLVDHAIMGVCGERGSED